MLLAMFALTSCSDLMNLLLPSEDTEGTEDSAGEGEDTEGEESEGDENDGLAPEAENIIFSPEVEVTIIKTDDVGTDVTNLIADKIYTLTGKFALINSDNSFVEGREIVIGATKRAVTRTAKNIFNLYFNDLLEDYEKKEFETRFLSGFIVYSDGNSVALYWDDPEVKDLAIRHFVNNYLHKATLCLADGYQEIKIIDKSNLVKEEEKAAREEQFALIAAAYGQETADAVRAHLSMFDERFYLWLADLYDPGKYDEKGQPLGGGFYYSNSARDTTGYCIDLESTVQALNFLSSAGMITSSSQYKEDFPEKMQREMIAFALSCQSSEDGYFYHPQWGKNVQISRISRDLSWATTILSKFGARPLWDTPNNVEGEYGAPGAAAPVSALTAPLSGSSVASVSKVLAVADVKVWTGSAHLATVAAWQAYLENLTVNIRTNSYSIGNTVGSQTAQITSRDLMAINNGELPDENKDGKADGGYIETFETIFNGLQLSNGLWEECSIEEGTVYYNAINGLMKISGAYNGVGAKLNYAEEALSAAAFMVTYIGESEDGSDWADSKGKVPNGSVDVYNPWVCVCNILKNISLHSSAEEAEDLRERIIKTNALEMVTVTTRKIAKFKKSDGSYGYTWDYSPSSSQGAPASVPNTVEGDVNGGGIAFTGTYGNMASALGFSALKPFGRSDLYKFIDRASLKTHNLKDAVADFDGDTAGETSTSVSLSGTKGSAIAVADPREGAKGNVLEFKTVKGTGNSINLSKIDNNSSKSGICLEWEMAFTEINVGSSTAFQIKLGPAYMFIIGVGTNGNLTIGDSSSTNGSVAKATTVDATFNAKEWNKFRVEYYVLNQSSKTVAAKLYVNDVLAYVSNNYVGKEKSSTPSKTYKNASFYALSGVDFTVQFDNIKVYDLVKKYQAEEAMYKAK